MKDYTVYVVKELGSGRYFRKRSIVHGLRLVDWAYTSDRAFKIDRRGEAKDVVRQLTTDGYAVDIYVHSKGAQCKPGVGISQRRTAWCLSLSIVVALQTACLTSRGVVLVDHTGWADEADVRRAVELVLGSNVWIEADPLLEIALVTTVEDLARGCKGDTDHHGCFHRRSIPLGVTDTVTVLLPEYEVCLADAGYSVLVHELVHRWQHDHGYPNGHPTELFGDRQDNGHGGLTGQLECDLAEDICSWYSDLSPRCHGD
jgi:hypothetical protein